jgi:hypothetical protein
VPACPVFFISGAVQKVLVGISRRLPSHSFVAGVDLTTSEELSDVHAIWPSFYYSPIAAGKNAWLLWQAFFIGVYFVGAALMFNTVRRSLNAIPATA